MKKILFLLLPLMITMTYSMDNPYKRKREQFYEIDLLTAVRLADATRVRELTPRVPRAEANAAYNLALEQLQAAQNDPARKQKLERIVEFFVFYLD